MTIFIIIYIIGFLISYYICRKDSRAVQINNWGNDDGYSWEDIKDNFIVSLFSWIVVFVVIIMHIIPNFINKFKNTKPPKFL